MQLNLTSADDVVDKDDNNFFDLFDEGQVDVNPLSTESFH